jgi:amidase
VLAAGAVEGALAGLTFVAKDLLDVDGHRTGAGNPTWLELATPAAESAAAVAALLRAGATCIGKSHTDEFAFSLSGTNAHYGTPRNAAAPGCTPGGSSSGSAAAVAGGLVPFGLGTDTGGSIRVPASYCGIVGMRPTHGAVSLAGVVPLASTFDTVGWLADTVETASRVGDVLLPPDSAAAPQRLALLADAQAAAPSQVRREVEKAARELSRCSGLPLTTLALPEADLDAWLATFRTLQTYEANAERRGWIDAHPGAVSPDVQARFDAGAAVTPTQLQEARQMRSRLQTAVVELLTGPPTALIVASSAGPATRLDADPETQGEIRTATLRLTCVAGIGGLPGLGLPMAQIDGLPLGVCLVGAPGTDRALLDIAARSVR